MATNKTNRHIDEKTSLMFLAGPMFVELFLNILINNIDTVMLSRYSDNAAGAVGVSNQAMFLMILLFNIIATATSVVVAQYLGAEKKDQMNMIYTLAFAMNLVAGVVLSGGLVLARGWILNLLNTPETMVNDAMLYIEIVGGGLFVQACYNVMLQILRCNGHAKVGMYISLLINGINIVGNYLFLYGPLKYLGLGVGGVAISTVVARMISIILALAFFYWKKIGHIAIRYIIPFPTEMLVKMLKIGLPSAGENVSYNVYQLVLLSFINSMGDDATNAKVYCAALMSFAMVFSNAAAMATQIIVGHLVGSKKEDAAYRRVFDTLKISLPVTIGLATINCLISPWTLRIFTSNENIIRLGFYILLVDIMIETGRCLNMTFISSLKAAGDYVFPFIVGLISMWGFGVTVGYTMGIVVKIGVAGVFIGTATDELLRGLIVMTRWRKQRWRGKAVIEK